MMEEQEARLKVSERKEKSDYTRLVRLQNRLYERGKADVLKSLSKCNRTPINNSDVDIVKGKNGEARIRSMIMCGKEVCPVCMARTRKVLELVTGLAILWLNSQGYTVFMETYNGISDTKKSNRHNERTFINALKRFKRLSQHLEKDSGIDYCVSWLEGMFNLITDRVNEHAHQFVFLKADRQTDYESFLKKRQELWHRVYSENSHMTNKQSDYIKTHGLYVSRNEDGSLKKFTNANYMNKLREEYKDGRTDYTVQMVQLLDFQEDEYTDQYIDYCEEMSGERLYGFSRKLKNLLWEKFGIPKTIRNIRGETFKQVQRLYRKMQNGESMDELHMDSITLNEEEKEEEVILKIHQELWFNEILPQERDNYNAREEMLTGITERGLEGMKDWLTRLGINHRVKMRNIDGKEVPMIYSDVMSKREHDISPHGGSG